jgi:hypothetical protein
MSNPKDLASLPYSTAHPFIPTLAYYIYSSKKHYKSVVNLTNHLLPLSESDVSPFLSGEVLERAKTLHISADAPPILRYTLDSQR